MYCNNERVKKAVGTLACMYALRPDRMQLAIPVIAILHDHLDVPSIVICSACSIESMCVSGSTENVVLRAGTGNKNTDTTTYEHSRRLSYSGRRYHDPVCSCRSTNWLFVHTTARKRGGLLRGEILLMGLNPRPSSSVVCQFSWVKNWSKDL